MVQQAASRAPTLEVEVLDDARLVEELDGRGGAKIGSFHDDRAQTTFLSGVTSKI